jgi:hypothetical protein
VMVELSTRLMVFCQRSVLDKTISVNAAAGGGVKVVVRARL